MKDNSVTELCGFCGLSLPAGKSRGRKMIFHPKCGQLSRLLVHFISSVEDMEISIPARERIRKEMFYVANSCTPPARGADGRFLKYNGDNLENN